MGVSGVLIKICLTNSRQILYTDPETCKYTSETNRTVPCKKGTVPCKNRTVQSVHDNLYANPAPKSVPYRADYHVIIIFSDQVITLQLIMTDVTRCRRTY